MGSLSGTHLSAGRNITVKARTLPQKKILDQAAEEVSIISPTLNLTIWSSPASKRGFSDEEQVEYAHLNMDLNRLRPRANTDDGFTIRITQLGPCLVNVG